LALCLGGTGLVRWLGTLSGKSDFNSSSLSSALRLPPEPRRREAELRQFRRELFRGERFDEVLDDNPVCESWGSGANVAAELMYWAY